MVRDVTTTFSNKQVLTVPSAADLTDTAATAVVIPGAHSPAGGWNLRGHVKNTGANAMTTGVLIVTAQFSTDGGGTWRTLGPKEHDIAAARLAVGASVTFNIPIGSDFFVQESIAPANVQVRLRYRTSGHSTASVATLNATAYLNDAGVGAFG